MSLTRTQTPNKNMLRCYLQQPRNPLKRSPKHEPIEQRPHSWLLALGERHFGYASGAGRTFARPTPISADCVDPRLKQAFTMGTRKK